MVKLSGILTDKDIAAMSLEKDLITPFVSYSEKREQTGKITWGVSSCGYDVRLDTNFKRYIGSDDTLDPKHPNSNDLVSEIFTEPFSIKPGGFILGTTVETFNLPKNVMGLCIARSTYARHGVICHTTPLIPGFRGQVTLEISNTSNRHVRLYPGEGICQFIFITTTSDVYNSYAMLGGKYMNQQGTTGPRA